MNREAAIATLDERLGEAWITAMLAELAEHAAFLCSRGRSGEIILRIVIHEGRARDAHVNGTRVPRRTA